MNFKDLAQRLQQIDESQVSECGMPMSVSSPAQQDNVNMNISMSGSGKGGIRDLLNVLRDLEQGSEDDAEIVIGTPSLGGHDDEEESEPVFGEVGEEFANEPSEHVAPVDAVLPTGNDLASKGAEAEKVNGGGNPFNVDESLVSHLANLYNEVKSR